MFVRFSSQYQINTKNNKLHWSKNLRKYILKGLRILLRFFRKIKSFRSQNILVKFGILLQFVVVNILNN